MFKLDLEKAEEPEIKLSTVIGSWRTESSSKIFTHEHLKHLLMNIDSKTPTSALLTMSKPLTVWVTTNWKILKQMGIPGLPTCLLRNLYASQEATITTGHGTIDWFKIKKAVLQG